MQPRRSQLPRWIRKHPDGLRGMTLQVVFFYHRQGAHNGAGVQNSTLKSYVPPGCPMHMFVRHYMRLRFARDSEENYEGKQTKREGVVAKCNMSIERHASKIYTRAMFEQLSELLYQAYAYRIEELEKCKLYEATHTQAERQEKWTRVVYEVKILESGVKFECECGLFEHTGMPCCHMLKVMDVQGYTEIPQQLILKRWTRDARDMLLPHLQIYQRDHAGSRTMTHRHTTFYVHAMELVCLGDSCVEAYEKGMKLIREGITVLSEFEDQRWASIGRRAIKCSTQGQ